MRQLVKTSNFKNAYWKKTTAMHVSIFFLVIFLIRRLAFSSTQANCNIIYKSITENGRIFMYTDIYQEYTILYKYMYIQVWHTHFFARFSWFLTVLKDTYIRNNINSNLFIQILQIYCCCCEIFFYITLLLYCNTVHNAVSHFN